MILPAEYDRQFLYNNKPPLGVSKSNYTSNKDTEKPENQNNKTQSSNP